MPRARRPPGLPSAFSLAGRTALVTGAAGLLGRAHAAGLLSAGASVVLTDVDVKGLAAARAGLARDFSPKRIRALRMDVTDIRSVRGAAKKLLPPSGEGVRILVNNACLDPKVGREGLGARPGARGGAGVEASRFENFPLPAWEREIAVGLTGAFLTSQVFGTWMARNGGGSIVNIASDLSVIAPDQRLYRKPDLAPDRQPAKPVTYSVLKTGLIGLTRYLATYWAEAGVRVNALSPGGVRTQQDEAFVRRLESLIPMGRMASRDEYRAAIVFLASDASAYMTGQNLVMDGGRSVW